MVVTPILAYFLNDMRVSAYSFLKFKISHLCNIYKIMQISILLSDIQVFISNVIIEGERSLKLTSTASWLILVSFLAGLCSLDRGIGEIGEGMQHDSQLCTSFSACTLELNFFSGNIVLGCKSVTVFTYSPFGLGAHYITTRGCMFIHCEA